MKNVHCRRKFPKLGWDMLVIHNHDEDNYRITIRERDNRVMIFDAKRVRDVNDLQMAFDLLENSYKESL